MDQTHNYTSSLGLPPKGSAIFLTIYWLTVVIVVVSLCSFILSHFGIPLSGLNSTEFSQSLPFNKAFWVLAAWVLGVLLFAILFFCKIYIFSSKLQQSLSRVDDKGDSPDRKNWSAYALKRLEKQQEYQLYMGCCWLLGFSGGLMRSMWEIGVIFALFIQFFGLQSPKNRAWLKANGFGACGLCCALAFSLCAQFVPLALPAPLFQPITFKAEPRTEVHSSASSDVNLSTLSNTADTSSHPLSRQHHYLTPASYNQSDTNQSPPHSIPDLKVNNNNRANIIAICVIAIFICSWLWILQLRINQHISLSTTEKKLREYKQDKDRYKKRAHRLCQYLSPRVWKFISLDNDKKLLTERKQLTVFFSDIKGFTSLSEELEAEILTELLNDYLTEMSKIVTRFGGSVNKFMGDGLMVIFGDHQSQGAKQDCLNCTAMALSMRKQMKSLQYKWHNQGIKKPLEIRMGINSGFCTIGTFGARAHHLDYTALGTHVNLASRLETAASPGEILLSREAWTLVQDTIMCASKGTIEAKGFSHPVEVYQVVDFRKNLGANRTFFSSSKEGFSMHLDLEKVRNFDQKVISEELERALDNLKKKLIL